jgi:plastocyanin
MLTLSSAIAIALLAATGAGAQALPVTAEFQAFAPNALDALPGDTVTWSNHGGRTHTVTADNGEFDSGELSDGQTFTHTFTTTGTHTYHCIIHPGMIGQIDVYRVTLDLLPPAAVLANTNVVLSGRTADPTMPVRIERDTGTGFRTVTTASPQVDGTWSAKLVATRTARVRAASGAGVSETRRLLVIDRTLRLHVTTRNVGVEVVPADPYALVALQLRLRDRFGWWPVVVKRLDYLSEATFPINHRSRVLARIVLLGPDHWTPLALSRTIHIGT